MYTYPSNVPIYTYIDTNIEMPVNTYLYQYSQPKLNRMIEVKGGWGVATRSLDHPWIDSQTLGNIGVKASAKTQDHGSHRFREVIGSSINH